MSTRFLKTAAVDEDVLSLAEARKFLELDPADTSQDTTIQGCRAAARDQVENETNCAIGSQTWIYYLDKFPVCGEIELPLPPLISVTSVKYLNSSNTLTTLSPSSYVVTLGGRDRGKITLAYSSSWPAIYSHPQAIQIEFVCGFKRVANTANGEQPLPGALLSAIQIAMADAFDNRAGNDDSEQTIKRLCKPYLSERFGE
jgi:uncharacterized phiE125 gp8 family phage protein